MARRQLERDGRSLVRPAADTLPALLNEARNEYEVRSRALDSLDGRLVAVLALVGVLLALPLDVPLMARVVGSAVAVGAGVAGVVGMWPRRFPLVNAGYLADKIGQGSREDLEVQTLGLLIEANKRIDSLIRTKGRLLAASLLTALVAALIYSVGVIMLLIGGA